MPLVNANALHLPFADGVFNCVVTSPPYFGLRAYTDNPPMVWGGDDLCDHEWGTFTRKGISGGTGEASAKVQSKKGADNFQIVPDAEQATCRHCGAWRGCYGLEPTLELYVAHTVWIFREVHRVLRDDGVLWLNLGDSFSTDTKWGGASGGKNYTSAAGGLSRERHNTGLKPKDLCGIPWRVAFALQADGWWLRSDCIWAKPNPMPESVTDRPTKSHEYVFLLTKAERYWYDAEAVKEDAAETNIGVPFTAGIQRKQEAMGRSVGNLGTNYGRGTRNLRTVWTVATQPYAGAHFATFPEALAERCILAGCPKGGAVFDPFVGSGTTVQAAKRLGRRGYGTDLSLTYLRENALPRAEGKQTAASIAALPLFAAGAG